MNNWTDDWRAADYARETYEAEKRYGMNPRDGVGEEDTERQRAEARRNELFREMAERTQAKSRAREPRARIDGDTGPKETAAT